jgi:hypothetical protein
LAAGVGIQRRRAACSFNELAARPAREEAGRARACIAFAGFQPKKRRQNSTTLSLTATATAFTPPKKQRWKTTGAVYVSNIRLVFVADKPDPSGLAGFDLPLVYISSEKLNQPIFGCNNLSGACFPAVEGGGPSGSLPPHSFKVLFKNGGMGTLYPLFYALRQRALRADAAARASAAAAEHAPASTAATPSPPLEKERAEVEALQRKAFVDPSDPSTVYLTQPVDESARLLHPAPAYAASYGKDEAYTEGTGLRPG